MQASAKIKKYYAKLLEDSKKIFEIAERAKKKGIDYNPFVETKATTDLADRAEKLVGPKGIAKRYRELNAEISGENKRLRIIFQIFREILEQKWVQIPDIEKRIEQAIKTALVLYTDGVVVSPIEGISKVLISKNPDGTKYIDIYYAGPIRAAGGTSQVLPLVLGDYARRFFNLDRYKPTKQEVERYVEEVRIYNEILSRQKRLEDNEVRKIIENCPVCINGEPTEEREVSINRDLPRIPHNRVRGGACLVITEGLALKARKVMKMAKMLELNWDWLEEIIKHGKSESEKPGAEFSYLEGLAAGRPVLSHPSRFGGFRLRYGRCRACGIMGKAMHPATLVLLDNFIAIGTQIKIERPGKSAVISACDSIEGPIVRLKNGNVLRIESKEQALNIKNDVEKILFLGDILVPFGDFKYSAHPLMPAGYNEDWWKQEVKKFINEKEGSELLEKAIRENISVEEAIEISEKYGLPLNPRFYHFYSAWSFEDLLKFVKEFKKSKIFDDKIIIDFEVKGILEKAGIPHKLCEEGIAIEGSDAKVLKRLFADANENELEQLRGNEINEIISKISKIKIRDKAGTFIGARMGRPEASAERKMKGNPHVLFPIENYGTMTRSINKASEISRKNGYIEIETALFKCPKCGLVGPFYFCKKCNVRMKPLKFCPKCGITATGEKCKKCGSDLRSYTKHKFELHKFLDEIEKIFGEKIPNPVKGVIKLMSLDKVPEPLEKGILRAKYNLHVFRDGTIRYDIIDMPLTHFKPKEAGVSVEKLRELGYEKDIYGKELENEEQILELFPQDIIIHEKAGDFLVKVAKFVDEELQKIYGMRPFYNVEKKEDLIGHYVLGLAPHTSAAVLARIIGFTKARCWFAHPYLHQAKRRNTDGDQDAIMLFLDVLLNFSEAYLPKGRGGRMDAPLVFTTVINPEEIDTEVYNMDIAWEYPLELYEKSQEYVSPDAIEIETVEQRLGKENQYDSFGYTHESSNFADGPEETAYVKLSTMEEKMLAQARLQEKILAVDQKDALARVIETHLFPDIIGNMRSFNRQQFRCTSCNEKFRRVPLQGICPKCGKNTIALTISRGSVEKYVKIAKEIIHKYDLSEYLKERIELIEEEINLTFQNKNSQKNILEFFNS